MSRGILMGNITTSSALAIFFPSLTLPSSLTALGNLPGCPITYMLMQSKAEEQDVIHCVQGVKSML